MFYNFGKPDGEHFKTPNYPSFNRITEEPLIKNNVEFVLANGYCRITYKTIDGFKHTIYCTNSEQYKQTVRTLNCLLFEKKLKFIGGRKNGK